ncbi:transmembrane 4 L6 family member 20 [Hippopotamus amphibius kiboko]|uniref:transmembrane 4 L6 family member 20 n=1 Tax=Hippopotamus amphibius kiboko TaxID=575201 RepID=UPI002592BEB5|nr:transmembrane 4 L6 family member 20 [Hippopotamus amphibius kiboko]
MTCCEGWTACNGFSLLVLLLLGVTLNAIPLIINLVEEDQVFNNPISCFEWWLPGIIGAGLMAIPATTMSLAARKRACCNNKTGMFLSSLLNVITVIGAAYCLTVSLQALAEGPLICNSQSNRTSSCEFSFKNLTDFYPESFDLQWFFEDSCVAPMDSNNPSINNATASNWRTYSLHVNSIENRHRIIHFSVFLGLLLVGILETLFGLSQMVIGFLGCLCGGVSKRRSQIV